MAASVNVGGVEERLPRELVEHYGEALGDAAVAMELLLSILRDEGFHQKTGWKKAAEGDGVVVYQKDLDEGRFFAASTVMPLEMKELFDLNWDRLDACADWNSNIAFSKRARLLTPRVDIAHYASADVAVVKSREFVCSRMCREEGDALLLAARSTRVRDLPEERSRVRAFLHLGGGRYRPHTQPHHCIYDYIVCMDLKGMLLKSVMNAFMGKLVLSDVLLNRRHAQSLAAQKRGS